MQLNSKMLRTFWPATSLDDLPNAAAVADRLSAWSTQWFGDRARITGSQIVSTEDTGSWLTFACGGAVVAAVIFQRDFELNLTSQLPLLTPDDAVIRSYAREVVADLCRDVFGSQRVLDPAVSNGSAPQVPTDFLTIGISVDEGEDPALNLYVSAELFFEAGTKHEASVEISDRRGAFSNVPVLLSVERSISISASELVGLAADDFVPIAEIGDVGFDLVVSGKLLGVGYIGQVENGLAIVVES